VCSCHHPSAALEKWRQFICWLHYDSCWLTDAFLWPTPEMIECWMVCPNIFKEGNCTAQSGCSLRYAHYVLHLKWTCAWPSCANWYNGQWPVLLYTCRIRWGQLVTVNNHNYLSMESFCSRTMQLLTAIIMCAVWCNNGAGSCWHILPTLNISPLLISGCFHIWKNIFRVNNLNLKTISSVLSLLFALSEWRWIQRCSWSFTTGWGKCVDSAGDDTEWRIYV
jgi:hypothetical protein